MDSTLGGRQTGKSKTETLPPGNPNADQRLQIYAIVYDALGATTTREFSVRSVFVPNVPVLIEKATMAFNDAMATGNLRSASQVLTLFGGLLGHKAMTTDEMKEDAARLRTTLAGLVAEYYAPRGQRRRRSLLSSHPSPCQCDEICVQNLGGNHAYLWSASSPAALTEGQCTDGLKTISTELGQACTIGMDDNSNEERKKTNAEQFLTVVAKCQQHMTHGSYSHARNIIDYVGVLWMKGKGTTSNDEMKFHMASEFFVIYKRFPSSRG
jgi:hypothetical protein